MRLLYTHLQVCIHNRTSLYTRYPYAVSREKGETGSGELRVESEPGSSSYSIEDELVRK